MIDEAKAEEALARAAVTNRRWAIFQTLFFAFVLALVLAQPWAPPGPPAGGDPDGVLLHAVTSELDEVLYGVPVAVRMANGAGVIQCDNLKESRGWSDTTASADFTYDPSIVDAIASNAVREGFAEVTPQGCGPTMRWWTKELAGRPARLAVFNNPDLARGGKVFLSIPTPQPPGYRSTC